MDIMGIKIPWKLEKLSISELYELIIKLKDKLIGLDVQHYNFNELWKHVHSCYFQIGYKQEYNKFIKYGIHYIHSVMEGKELK